MGISVTLFLEKWYWCLLQQGYLIGLIWYISLQRYHKYFHLPSWNQEVLHTVMVGVQRGFGYTVNSQYLKVKVNPKLLIFQRKFSDPRKFTLRFQ